MSRTAERLRWLMALAGVGFWVAGWWVLAQGDSARWQVRCAGRNTPDCFSDYIPMIEMIMPWFGLALGYLVARFTFTMWAPEPETRSFNWWPASRRGGGGSTWPVGQLIAGLGILSSLWSLSTFPLVADLLPFHVFWGASALWCALTVWIAWPPREEVMA